MPNIISKAVSAVWKAIKSAAFWIGRSIASAIEWVFDQFKNLWSCFSKTSVEVIVEAAKAKGIPESVAKKKVDDIL